MFTGIVGATATVRELEGGDGGARLVVESSLARELSHGDSIAVNGVCLTALDPNGNRFGADVMAETLRRSSLGALSAGDAVNVELPLRPSDRLGGHIVQGHVDTVGTVDSICDVGESRVVRIACADDVLRYVAEKGSIAVDGVSLTVTSLDGDGFDVSLIPETLARTTFGALSQGQSVNLEVDVLAKYVERLVRR